MRKPATFKATGGNTNLVSVAFGAVLLPGFFHLLASKCFLFPVQEGGGLFKVFTTFVFANDPLFLDHALKSLD